MKCQNFVWFSYSWYGKTKAISACLFPVRPFDVYPILMSWTFHEMWLIMLTPWIIIPLEKLTVTQLVEKFLTFYVHMRFMTELAVHHWSVLRARKIKSTFFSQIFSIMILVLSSHLCFCLPCGPFLYVFPTKIVYVFLCSPMCAMCPTHLNLLDFITLILNGEQYRSCSSALCSFLHLPLTSSSSATNFLLST